LAQTDFKEGFTAKSFLGILYSILIFTPAMIFTSLVSGSTVLFAGYVVMLLFVELGHYTGSPLKKQELTTIFIISGVTGPFLMLLQALYFRSLSPITSSFTWNGVVLPQVIPDFFAPGPSSLSILDRTFFNPDWMASIIVVTLSNLFAVGMSIPLGLLNYQIYVVEEKLPFPREIIAAETITTLSDRKPDKLLLFSLCALMSSGYNIFCYLLPFATNGNIRPIPMPWIDGNLTIEKFLQGASFGIGTDLIFFALGMMLPLKMVVSVFIGSFALYFVGNPLLVHFDIFKEWRYGMDLTTVFQRSTLSFWAFLQIGLTAAAAITPLLIHPSSITKPIKSLLKLTDASKKKGILSLRSTLILYFAFAFATLALWGFIVPDFPLAISAILVVVWPLISSLIANRGLGESGMVVSVPYVNEVAFTLNGVQNINTWFVPTIGQPLGVDWCANFKICDMTETKFTSLIKAFVVALPIAWITNFLFIQAFWSLAPIPSSIYPAVDIYWQINVLNRCLWITGRVSTQITLIMASFVIGIVLSAASIMLNLPISMMGIAIGALNPLPVCLTFLIGGVVGWFAVRRKGIKWWGQNQAVIVGGIMVGEATTIAVSVAIGMIVKSAWVSPF
jgi:hypothetical protein